MLKNIMIVDDSKEFRTALSELLKTIFEVDLKEFGNLEKISEAENGADLLKKIKKNQPELIFMDIEMPYIDGFDATKAVSTKYPNIIIVGMSAYEKESYIQKLIDVGAHGYLLKTGNNYEVIKELIEGKIDSFIYSPEISHHTPLLKSYKRILFADKFEDKHLSLKHFLRKCGYTILKAKNATESLFFIKNDSVDAIIIDESVINKNNNFLSTIQDISNNLFIFLINNKYIVTEFEDKGSNQIIKLKEDFSFDSIVKIIETH